MSAALAEDRDQAFGTGGKPTSASNRNDGSAPQELKGPDSNGVSELTSLYEFAERLQAANSTDDIYQAALTAICQALGCERSSILLLDGSGVMRFVAWLNLSEAYRTVVDGHSPWTADAQSPEPVYIEDIWLGHESESLKSAIAAEGIRALAFIPLIADGKLIGKFMTYHPNPHIFTAKERSLGTIIARGLEIKWAVMDERILELQWTEKNGPPVRQLNHRGFGSRFIQDVLAHDPDWTAVLKFPPAGVTALLTIEIGNQLPAKNAATQAVSEKAVRRLA